MSALFSSLTFSRARLRLPNKLAIDANQAAGLQLHANALEFLPRAFGITIEHALSVKLLAPLADLDNNDAGWQL